MPCTVDIKNNKMYVKFYSLSKEMFYEKLDQVKSIPQFDRRFLEEEKAWEIVINKNNIELLKSCDFEFINEGKKLLGKDYFKPNEHYLPEIDESLLDDRMYFFQKTGVRFLEGREGLGGVFDEMGCIDGESSLWENSNEYYGRVKIKDLWKRFNLRKGFNDFYTYSFNEETKHFFMNKINNVLYKGKKKVVYIYINSRLNLRLTPDHELLTYFGWKEVKDIKEGDCVYTYKEELEEIIYKEELEEEIDVYDIVMEDPHRNFIANNIVVHNCGKTVQSLMYLKLHPELRPILIVCPATLKLNWKKEIEKWMTDNEKVEVLQGRTAYEINDPTILIMNYDILGKTEIIEKEVKGELKKVKIISQDSWCYYLRSIGLKVIIADECQKISNYKAIKTKSFIKIKRRVKKFIPLSGTPIKNRPSEFFTVLNLLDPITFYDRWKYLQKFCGPKFNGFGYTFKGISNADELYKLIYPLMIRRKKEEVLKELPEKTTIVIPLECSDIELEKYYKKYKEIFDKELNNKIKVKNEIEKLKQLAYAAKRDFVIQWIKDFLETGEKLVLFAVHIKVLDDIQKQFKDICVRIDGGVKVEDRQKAVDNFQTKKKIKLFLGQIRAAGEGITLTAARTVVHVELDWNPATHDQASDRTHRISQKADAVFIYYLIANGTIEDDIIKLLQEKGKMLGKVLDGKESEFIDTDIYDDLIKRIKEKK